MAENRINLEGLEIEELEELKKRIDSQIFTLKEQKHFEFIQRMEEQAEKEGVSFREVLRMKKGILGKASDRRAAVEPKYRDSDGNKWTGRGRAPKWILAHLGVDKLDKNDPEQTRKLEELRIKDK